MTFEDFRKICLGKRYRKTIQLPYETSDGTDFFLDIRILNSYETMEAEAMTMEYIRSKKLGKESDSHSIESHCQVLYRCCYEKDSEDVKFFKKIEDVRSLPIEMVIYLWEQYSVLSGEISVQSEELTEDKIESIKKKLSNGEIPLGLSFWQLQQLVLVWGGYKYKETLQQEQPSDAELKTSQEVSISS